MESGVIQGFKTYLKRESVQKNLILAVTLIISFFIVFNGAMPKKYQLNLGDISQYDIVSPREIINTVKTRENAELAAKNELPDIKEISNASIEVISELDEFLTTIKNERRQLEKNIKGLSKSGQTLLKQKSLDNLLKTLNQEQVTLVDNVDVEFLLLGVTEDEFDYFEHVLKTTVSNTMREDITVENVDACIVKAQINVQNMQMAPELKSIGSLIVNNILKPNRTINEESTIKKRELAYNDPKNIEKIKKGQRIISVGDKVTEDKLQLLEELNMLETKGKIDYGFMLGIFIILSFLAVLLVFYMRRFCKKTLKKKNELVLISLIIISEMAIARLFGGYSTLMIPIFFAGITISILLDVGLALIVNLILMVAISFMTKGDIDFMYTTLISGSLVCFFSSKANQRNKLTLVGIFVGVMNSLIICSIGMINKVEIHECMTHCFLGFVNGIISIIITIGVLPFVEATFDVITPMRLLELSNPNQPLIKRLLLEAPGTYHHSLMVGNLAEAGADAVGGNALLARVAAYYHDVGKLKRPNFFIENQSSDNPHDRMTPNLSALVITSHTIDGGELGRKYKLPMPIVDIITQHHGTTMVAYFYHKAKLADKGEVKEENFRYQGSKPTTKEAAVVMLADSVEAAVRSMTDKTEGKMEGYIRKIIKDKLDDGQFDLCNLTLKDMDNIAKAFMKVLSGCFHEREEYPQIRTKNAEIENLSVFGDVVKSVNIQEGGVVNDNLN